MKKLSKGFTLVELLIVIVVIAILAAVTIAAYNGVQSRANNSTRAHELAEWRQLFEAYKAVNGSYPSMAQGSYCLGSGFPKGYDGVAACGDYLSSDNIHQSSNSSLLQQLNTVGSSPGGPRTPVKGAVGPFVQYTPYYIQLISVINGTGSDCVSPTVVSWDSGTGLTYCMISLDPN